MNGATHNWCNGGADATVRQWITKRENFRWIEGRKKTRNACVATDSQKFRTTRIFYEREGSQSVGEDLRVSISLVINNKKYDN